MKQMNFITHLAVLAIATIIIGLVYGSVQQCYRTGANDPQLQIAGDISTDLQGQKENAVVKWFDHSNVEISQSLAVFNALYDEKGEPAVSTGVLHGKMPALPHGVFEAARTKGENVFTWQPERGTRMAIVLRSVNASPYSFVAVGRSLREIESREESLRWMVVIAWLLCAAVIAVHFFVRFMKNAAYGNE